jgi:gamma-glutamyltranspeptidase
MMSLKAVSGTEAMVVSPHHLASAAGAKMLMRGGNAFDAAVAVSACLAVVYPHLAGLGGDAFWMTYSRGDEAPRVYNASGRSGHRATREQFAGQPLIPSQGAKSVLTVPGMVDGWQSLLREYGTMPLAEVLEPAISYAANGMPVAPHLHGALAERALMLSMHSGTARVYLPGGKIPQAGTRLVQRQLGESLRKLAADGIEIFYQGELARTITESLQTQGGLLTMEDFAAHRGEWTTPVTDSYRGYEICQAPPNSQGIAGILALQILENKDISAIPHGSYEYYHLLVEAVKAGIRDRDLALTDPGFNPVPMEKLLSKDYGLTRFAAMGKNLAADLKPNALAEDSVYAAVTDKEGNAVSFMQGLAVEFGSLVMAGDTGILLHNQGAQFNLDPQHPNVLEPGKRSLHSLMPAMALRDGKPAILYGAQGGDGQAQTQTAILTRMIDYGMDPQEAILEPRWVWGRTRGEPATELRLEKRITGDTIDKLRQAGHQVKIVKPVDGLMGHAHAIRIMENGCLAGGTDPRSDGSVIGW